jgi:site-specific DNA-methyltransferase (adenine-specific)
VEPEIDVRLGAFPWVLDDVAPEVASLVVADPPWNDLAAWSQIGEFAARVLKPNGTLLAYIGNRHCFEAIDHLSANLQPVRLAFLPATHEEQWDPIAHCHEAGSFMLIMAKGTFTPEGEWSNMVEAPVEGERWHRFQRPLANVRHYLEAFTRPGDLVVDPYSGSGTTAVACALTGRSFVGSDIRTRNVETTLARVRRVRDGGGVEAEGGVEAASGAGSSDDDTPGRDARHGAGRDTDEGPVSATD